jgi:hypothetical protein
VLQLHTSASADEERHEVIAMGKLVNGILLAVAAVLFIFFKGLERHSGKKRRRR